MKTQPTTKYQKFTVVRIQRCEIKNAPYNPRKIDDAARARLKKNIKKSGLIETLVVNKTTMNLVSGHQRIGILDSLEKNDQYYLDVAMVEMTEKEEKAQNIFMNNTSAQGEYDFDLLKGMFDDGIEWDDTGFSVDELAFIGVEMNLDDDIAATVEKEEIVDDIDTVLERQKAVKQRRKEYREKEDEANDANIYSAIVFKNSKELAEYCELLGLESIDTRYIDFQTFKRVLNAYCNN